MANEVRLIDAYALPIKFDGHTFSVWKCDLDAAPTVDAVPVVHGRWIAVPSSDMMTGKAYKCSECQKMRYGSFMPNYCSHCGAKMDGDEDE